MSGLTASSFRRLIWSSRQSSPLSLSQSSGIHSICGSCTSSTGSSPMAQTRTSKLFIQPKSITLETDFLATSSQSFWSFSKSSQSTTANNNNPDSSTTPESSEEASISENEKKLVDENKELKEKCDDLMDKYRRSLAESENMRNRFKKQVDDAKIFGIQSFVKDLLEVADVLNKAVEGVPQDVIDRESQYLKDMHQGLQLTESQLHQVFRRHGLEQVNPLNEKFDPNKHEALFQIPAPDKEPNTVLDVQKVGYILHGRTVRPALVGVSKK